MVSKRSSWLSKRSLIVTVVVIVAIVGVAYGFHIGPFKTAPKPATTASQYTKGQPASSSNSSGSKTSGSNDIPSTSGESPGTQKSNGGGSSTSSTATLITPTGDFVSDHRPNLSGSPAPNTMTSVCDTTPGATCQITFTSGSTVKSLPAQTVDAGGATYWDWKLQDYGLTAGTWQIEAIAKLNGQTQTASDPTNLVVSP